MPRPRHLARTVSRAVRPAVVALVAAGLASVALHAPADAATATTSASRPGPATIALPDGFQPEGIATGQGRISTQAFFGSRATGDIYAVDLLTGNGRLLSEGPGTPSLGMKVDRRGRIFVAGGSGGDARVIDSGSGQVLATYQFVAGDGAFINDVVLTKGAAFFTDSNSAQLFKVPLRRDGRLVAQQAVERLPLRGQWTQPDGLGANGITTTPDGRFLLVVDTTSGELYRVPRGNGRATRVDLGGASLTNGDGLLREGRTLYAVRNQLNQVAVLQLTPNGSRARLDHTVRTPRFDIPTTIARSGRSLYLPNARFSTEPSPRTSYTAVRLAIARK